MTGRSIDIALTRVEAGGNTEMVYENVCTLLTEPDLNFNYATAEDLANWGFSEGCFSCFLMENKKDVIIQVITTYRDSEGAKKAYGADVDYLKKNKYGMPVKTKTIGESSLILKKKDTDGITYNLLFLKSNVFAAVSAKYKKENAENLDHITALVEKIAEKIN